jgi:ADP-heptose:LPS heptosyltransferase
LSQRQRWQPVRGYAGRVYDARERALLRLVDLPALFLRRRLRAAIAADPVDPARIRRVLVLRLDRLGDLIMSLPALHDLRLAVPEAQITLAVGRWCESIAERAPVDEILRWSAPWVGRRLEGRASLAALVRAARALRARPPDLAIDLQGDVRAMLLMALTGARHRVGYLNTGGGWLLTHAVPLDETVSWVDQNRLAVRRALGALPAQVPSGGILVRAEDRALGLRLLSERLGGLPRPLVGVHPSGGRLVKQWDPARWRAVAQRLAQELGAAIVVTGSQADRALASSVLEGFSGAAVDLAGVLDVRETLAVISVLDLFLSADTGPMHMACAVGTPSVSVFGPSDPQRYFSAPAADVGARHVVVRADLWCAPCNLIRRPPDECAGPIAPECLRLVSVDEVSAQAAALLRKAGFAARVGR